MSETREALGLPAGDDDLLDEAVEELSFSQPQRARELCDQVLEGWPADAQTRSRALYLRGLAGLAEGDVTAIADLLAAAEHCDGYADPVGQAEISASLARAYAEHGQPADARTEYPRAIALLQTVGMPMEAAHAGLGLARLELTSGHPAQARAAARQTLRRLREVSRSEARRLEVLAYELLADCGPPVPEAIVLLREALERAERLELGARTRLRRKLETLLAHRGPFR